LPQESFDGLVRLLSGVKGPTWPFWVPILPSDSAHDTGALNAAIDGELAKAEPPARVIVSRQLEREILASKDLTSTARVKLPKGKDYPDMSDWDFWRAYLGVDMLLESTE
jgi:hypothetical protein